MAKNESIKAEYQFGWKALRDMAQNGIGHSNLSNIAKNVKEKEAKQKKK